MGLDEATPLIGAMQDISKTAKKAGYPRAENGAEMMTERARDRAKGKGQSVTQPDQFLKDRQSVGGGRVGKYGMTV